MKNKIILLVLVLFVVSSCGFGKKDEEIDKNLSGSVVEDNIISEKDGVVIKKEIVVENEVKNEDVVLVGENEDQAEKIKKLKNDENNYLKFEKSSMDKIVAYDCNNFKTREYIQKCTNYKNVMENYYNMMKNVQTKQIKIKMLNEGNITFCEDYLKTKDEEGYFNCSLAVVVGNGDLKKCSDIKNVENFTKYFGKNCNEIVVEMTKYIEELKMKQKYEKMLKGFWGEGGNIGNIDLNQVYFENITKK